MIEYGIFFVVYGVFGWIIDTAYRSIQAKRFMQGSFLKLPFCTTYGLGALLLIFFQENILAFPLIVQFLFLVILLSAFEFLVGFVSHKMWRKRYWDYREAKLNVLGYTDLEHAVYWGVLGLVFLHFVHPWVSFYL